MKGWKLSEWAEPVVLAHWLVAPFRQGKLYGGSRRARVLLFGK